MNEYENNDFIPEQDAPVPPVPQEPTIAQDSTYAYRNLRILALLKKVATYSKKTSKQWLPLGH